MTTTYLWNPPPVYSLPVRGQSARLPINRLFLVGRNYHAHAAESLPATGSMAASRASARSCCTSARPSDAATETDRWR